MSLLDRLETPANRLMADAPSAIYQPTMFIYSSKKTDGCFVFSYSYEITFELKRFSGMANKLYNLPY